MDGRKFVKKMSPPGFDDDPLTDEDLEEKFHQLSNKHFSKEHIHQIIGTIWDLENVDDINKLMEFIMFK